MSWGLACTVSSLKWDSKKALFMPHLLTCVIVMTARPCGIYSAAGNQAPIPSLPAAQISKQVQLCWLVLSPPSACVLFCMWVCCLPTWNSSSVGNNAPTSSRITLSLLDPSTKPKQAAASWPLCCLWWTLLGEFRCHCHPHLYFPVRHGSLGGWRRCICSSSPLRKTNRRGLQAHDKAGTGAGSVCCQRDSNVRTSIARCA